MRKLVSFQALTHAQMECYNLFSYKDLIILIYMFTLRCQSFSGSVCLYKLNFLYFPRELFFRVLLSFAHNTDAIFIKSISGIHFLCALSSRKFMLENNGVFIIMVKNFKLNSAFFSVRNHYFFKCTYLSTQKLFQHYFFIIIISSISNVRCKTNIFCIMKN